MQCKAMVANPSRREIVIELSLAVCAAAALPAVHASAAESLHLAETDPAAVALRYVGDAARVDSKKNPDFVAGSNCANCLQLTGRPGDAWRPCKLFPRKLVKSSGWCKAWTAEI
jgi:hypothetical protein